MSSKRKLIYVADWPYDADGRPLEFTDTEISRLLRSRPPAKQPKAIQRPRLSLRRPQTEDRPVAAL